MSANIITNPITIAPQNETEQARELIASMKRGKGRGMRNTNRIDLLFVNQYDDPRQDHFTRISA